MPNAIHQGALPFDPEAQFHLINPTLVGAVHTVVDSSDKNHAQSGGIIWNTIFIFEPVAHNFGQFANTRNVNALPEVNSLAASVSFTTTQES